MATSHSSPLVRVTLGERTAQVLKERIIWGDLPPGTRLIEGELASDLAISRTPIRQALQVLERDGLAVRQGSILIVAPFEHAAAIETLIIRELLEPLATKTSVPELTRSEIARLESILREMEAVIDDERLDPRRRAELNLEFHALLTSHCPYRRILEIVKVARDTHSALRLYYLYTQQDLQQVLSEHRAIFDAAVAVAEGDGDPDALAELVASHMRNSHEALRSRSVDEELATSE